MAWIETVAEEAAVTAALMGNDVERLYDVGVAGIHRLLDHVEVLTKARALVAALTQVFAMARERGWPEKAVVFTESQRTADYLERVLRDEGQRVGAMNIQTSSDASTRFSIAPGSGREFRAKGLAQPDRPRCDSPARICKGGTP